MSRQFEMSIIECRIVNKVNSHEVVRQIYCIGFFVAYVFYCQTCFLYTQQKCYYQWMMVREKQMLRL